MNDALFLKFPDHVFFGRPGSISERGFNPDVCGEFVRSNLNIDFGGLVGFLTFSPFRHFYGLCSVTIHETCHSVSVIIGDILRLQEKDD